MTKHDKRLQKRHRALGEQGKVGNGPNCAHDYCKRVAIKVKTELLANAQGLRLTSKATRQMLSSLPQLLCTDGEWPPKYLEARPAHILYNLFVASCLDIGATGLQGQLRSDYSKVVASIQQLPD